MKTILILDIYCEGYMGAGGDIGRTTSGEITKGWRLVVTDVKGHTGVVEGGLVESIYYVDKGGEYFIEMEGGQQYKFQLLSLTYKQREEDI